MSRRERKRARIINTLNTCCEYTSASLYIHVDLHTQNKRGKERLSEQERKSESARSINTPPAFGKKTYIYMKIE